MTDARDRQSAVAQSKREFGIADFRMAIAQQRDQLTRALERRSSVQWMTPGRSREMATIDVRMELHQMQDSRQVLMDLAKRKGWT